MFNRHVTRPARRSSRARRAGVALTAAGLCAAAATAILALITGRFDDTDGRVLASALAAALATLSGLGGSTVLARKSPLRWLGITTIATSGVALALALIFIWAPRAYDSVSLARALGVASVAMLACAHASLMLARLRPQDGGTVRALTRIAIGSASATGLLLCGLVVLVRGEVASGVWRLLGVLVVIAVLTTLLAPLARRINRASPRASREASLHAPR